MLFSFVCFVIEIICALFLYYLFEINLSPYTPHQDIDWINVETVIFTIAILSSTIVFNLSYIISKTFKTTKERKNREKEYIIGILVLFVAIIIAWNFIILM